MNEILLWVIKLALGGIVLMPFVGGIGCTWIDHWYKKKAELLVQQALASAEALKVMAERTKNDNSAD